MLRRRRDGASGDRCRRGRGSPLPPLVVSIGGGGRRKRRPYGTRRARALGDRAEGRGSPLPPSSCPSAEAGGARPPLRREGTVREDCLKRWSPLTLSVDAPRGTEEEFAQHSYLDSKEAVGRTSMGDPRRQGSGRAGCEPETWISESYSRILTCCICAGLRASEADDVAQDIWLWLLRQGTPALDRLDAVALRGRPEFHPSVPAKELPPEGSGRAPARRGARASNGLSPCRSSRRASCWTVSPPPSREIERRLLALIRTGHSLAEASRLLGIPRGSRAYYHQRLITCGRRELRVRRAAGHG